MNLPNKLTLGRIIATPVFMLTMLIDFPCHYFVALVVFIAASLTDMLDGKIARSRGLVTDFGKFLDPLADKMLTTAAFLGFIYAKVGVGITWIAFIVLFREFAVTSLRLVSAKSGKVIAANIWGKLKTVSQMSAIIFALFVEGVKGVIDLGAAIPVIDIAVSVLLWISAVLCIISGIIYMIDNKEFIDPTK